MSELEKRKRLLIAECEVYRETLKLELQTYKIYGLCAKKRLKSFNTYAPLLLTGLPLVRALFAGRKAMARGQKKLSGLKGLGTVVFMGLQLYQRFAPLLRDAFLQARQPEKTAAEEYLSKRI
jgi:hypothetical protein